MLVVWTTTTHSWLGPHPGEAQPLVTIRGQADAEVAEVAEVAQGQAAEVPGRRAQVGGEGLTADSATTPCALQGGHTLSGGSGRPSRKFLGGLETRLQGERAPA